MLAFWVHWRPREFAGDATASERNLMEPDDELCLCFHVTKRKVEQYLRKHRPVVASQLSECFGAGTGCGWCRPFLQRLHEQSRREQKGNTTLVGAPGLDSAEAKLPSASQYAAARAAYRAEQRAKPNEP